MHISIYWTDNAKIVDCKLNMIFFFFLRFKVKTETEIHQLSYKMFGVYLGKAGQKVKTQQTNKNLLKFFQLV